MLMVIKRSGKEEPFDIQKMKTTLTAASDELQKPLSMSDIQNIAKTISDKVSTGTKVTSKSLFELLIDTLKQQGFTDLANSYSNHASNTWA